MSTLRSYASKRASLLRRWAVGVATLDARSLALLRVCVGLCVVIDVLARADTMGFYTSSGDASSIQVPGDTPHRCLLHYIWFYRGSQELQTLLFALSVACALSMTIGYHTRVATLLAWVGYVGVQCRCECVSDGSDRMLRNVLLWCVFLPLGRCASIDRALSLRARIRDGSNGNREASVAPHSTWTSHREGYAMATLRSAVEGAPHDSRHAHAEHGITSAGTLGLLLQVVCIYWSVSAKRGEAWYGDLSAVHSMLSSPFGARPVPFFVFAFAPRSVRRPLLTLQVNPGSLYRCGKGD